MIGLVKSLLLQLDLRRFYCGGGNHEARAHDTNVAQASMSWPGDCRSLTADSILPTRFGSHIFPVEQAEMCLTLCNLQGSLHVLRILFVVDAKQ